MMKSTKKILIGAGIVLAYFIGVLSANNDESSSYQSANIQKASDPAEKQAIVEQAKPAVINKEEDLSIARAKADVVQIFEQSKPAPIPVAENTNCHPSYSGCLKMNAGDYDCAGGSGNGPNYTGTVQVFGYDEFGLDRDGDGWGCE